MRKRELASVIARDLDLQPGDVARVIDALFARLTDDLLEQRRFEIGDFGTFNLHDLKPRRVYVPKRKETIVIPARRTVKFREVGELRRRLNPATDRP